MGYSIKRLIKFDGLSERQIRNLCRWNQKKLSEYSSISQNLSEHYSQFEDDLEHILKCVQIFKRDVWRLADHFENQRKCPH